MAQHSATVTWTRNGARFSNGQYSRVHRWRFASGTEITASAAPDIVPPPCSDPDAVDPEEAFVAAIASCHMLWFLSIAAQRGFVVDRYDEEAEGVLEEDERARLSITRITLRPRVTYNGREPTANEELAMHHAAHDACFIANSVRTTISGDVPGVAS